MCRPDDFPPYDEPDPRHPTPPAFFGPDEIDFIDPARVSVSNDRFMVTGVDRGHVHEPSKFKTDRCASCAAKIEEAR